MKLFDRLFRREEKDYSLDSILRNILIAQGTSSGVQVTPDNCEKSPTVKAIVTAVSRRIATMPVHVLATTTKGGRDSKEYLPSHPVTRLLNSPNEWQDRVNFWLDATSTLVRYGNFYAYKSRGSTGPIRNLIPLDPRQVIIDVPPGQMTPRYRVYEEGGPREISKSSLVHVRGPGRNFYCGDSPVEDVKEAIALEVAAEKFGATFFGNGAVPLMVFKFMQGTAGFKTKEEQDEFIRSYQEAFSGDKRHRAMLLPKGIEDGKPVEIANDKAQFLETRKLQREIIAGAFGVPPHMVGHLANSTYNNVEQQSLDFVINVVLPYVRMFEAAMEASLLTTEDRNAGVVIRFNLDGALRGDFKTRQEGLKIMREAGVINANDWRDMEDMNPISREDGGEDFIRPMNMVVPGEEPDNNPPPPSDSKGLQVISLEPHFSVDVQPAQHKFTFGGAEVNVRVPQSNINVPVDVRHPDIIVQPSNFNVTSPDVNVYNTTEPPIVNVTNDVKTPSVHVTQPEVKVHNHVDTPEVRVVNEVKAPIVNVNTPEPKVSIQPVTIKAPDVHIRNEIPDFEEVESQAIRDAAGRIEKTITKKRRKK